MMKILVCGFGRWGANHVRALRSMELVEVFVADPSETARALARSAGVPEDHITARFEDCAAPLNAVDIVTPADTHFALCLAAIERGLDLFVEKPLCVDPEQCIRLADEAYRRGIILQVGHVFRFHPANGHILRLLRSEALGRLRWISAHFSSAKTPRSDTGVTWSDSLHFVDLINFLLGALPRSVMARLSDTGGTGHDDVSWMSLDYDGVEAEIRADCDGPHKTRELLIHGSAGSLEFDFQSSRDIRIYQRSADGSGVGQSDPAQVISCARSPQPLDAELRCFVGCVAGRALPPVGAIEAWQVARILSAACESSAQGRRLCIDWKTGAPWWL